MKPALGSMIALPFAAIFVASGVAKTLSPFDWAASAKELKLGRSENFIRTTLPASEITMGLTILLPRTRFISSLAATTFSIIGASWLAKLWINGTQSVDCGCFGALSKREETKLLILRNLVLSILGLAATLTSLSEK